MPKIAKELSSVEVNRLSRVGWHAVGGATGLLLQIRQAAQAGAPVPRSWVLRVRAAGQRHVIGLGPYPEVSLKDARAQARQLRSQARQGVNLAAQKRAQRSAMLAAAAKDRTFEQCAKAYMDAHSTDYSNEKHRKQWSATLETYAYPVIGKLLVADITMRHVLDVLLQLTEGAAGTAGRLWYSKTETAKRLLNRIKTVLDFATVNEYRSGTNPAQWTGYLDTQLPSPRKLQVTAHHPALPYTLIGDFMVILRANDSISARALEFLIMTGVRSGSVRAAQWSEVDFEKALWIIPAAHTKTRQEHRVPLARQAVAMLKALPRLADESLIFPSPRGGFLSDMALSQLMRGMRERGDLPVDAVPHGFRSSLRDWGAERTNYPDEVRRAVSGHVSGDRVKEAYQRTDLLEKRRRMMVDWANFLDAPSVKPATTVSTLRRA